MNAHWLAQGIRFNDCLFTEPVLLAAWVPPKYAGLFVILARDANWAPKPFQPLYFGEFGNNSREALPDRDRLRLTAAVGNDLFFSLFAMPFSTTAQRSSLRNQLAWAYNPVYQTNDGIPPAGDLTRKLDELERKHEEHSTNLQLLLATVNKLFEPQPEPPRRRIGFLAQPIPEA